VNVLGLKAVDRYVGSPLCILLSLFRRQQALEARSKIIFVQLWGIGETICTLPTIKAVKKKYPRARVTVLVTKRNRAVYEALPYVDDIIELNLTAGSVASFIMAHQNDFDIAVDMEEYLNISAIISFFVGKCRIGYSNQIRSRLYDVTVPYNDRQHVVQTYFELATPLGLSAKPKSLEPVAVGREAERNARRLLKGLKGKLLVAIGAGASESSRCRMWPAQCFAKLADVLISKHAAKIVFVGSGAEQAEVERIVGRMSNRGAINLAGKTSQEDLFALLGKFDLFIGNDSGPMHVAAAQGVRTVGLFGPNLPARFGPFGTKNASVYKGTVCQFSPCINVHLGKVPDCLYSKRSQDYQKCMKAISVRDVLLAAEEILK
jgi:heptosyltransferase-2